MTSSAAVPPPTRGVAIELDRTRYLRYPLSVLRKIQEDGNDRSIGQMLLMGLQKDDPELTLELVEDLVDLENLPALFEPMKKATGGIIDLSRIFKMAEIVSERPPRPPEPASGGAQ